MVKVLFHKKNKEHTNRSNLVKDAVMFAVDYFDLHTDDWRIEVHVVDETGEKNTVGLHHYYSGKQTSKIYIAAKNRSVSAILSTLFHEFTHAKHVIKGDIYFGPYGADLWKSSVIMRQPKTYDDYWNRPDEIDARKHQAIMLRKYTMKRIKDFFANLFKRSYTDEELDWHYNDRKPSYAEMQARRDNMSNPGDKDYDV